MIEKVFSNGKISVVDPNTLYLDPDPEFWPTLDPEPDPRVIISIFSCIASQWRRKITIGHLIKILPKTLSNPGTGWSCVVRLSMFLLLLLCCGENCWELWCCSCWSSVAAWWQPAWARSAASTPETLSKRRSPDQGKLPLLTQRLCLLQLIDWLICAEKVAQLPQRFCLLRLID